LPSVKTIDVGDFNFNWEEILLLAKFSAHAKAQLYLRLSFEVSSATLGS